MKIKVLVENTSHHSDLKGEHGLSLLIEFKKQKILFDTGQSELFYDNGRVLSEDLSHLDMIIISHGHYDHVGGLKKTIEIMGGPVYIQEEAFNNIYSCRDGCHYIGIEEGIKDSDVFFKLKGDYQINKDIILLNEVEKSFPLPEMNRHLYFERDGLIQRDEFFHEQSLILRENNKITLLTACSHLGILNIISACEKKLGRRPEIVFGGFHLSSDSRGFIDGQINFISKKLSEMNIDFYTGHCTGSKGYDILKKYLKNKIKAFHVGDVFEL